MYHTLDNYTCSQSTLNQQRYTQPPPTEFEQDTCSTTGVCKDWKSNPTFWGPHLWTYMHYSAANYPKEPTLDEIEHMKQWLRTLPVTIPCDTCKKHYSEYIQQHNDELESACHTRTTLFNFLVDIHNQVNQRHNKPIMSYTDAQHKFNF